MIFNRKTFVASLRKIASRAEVTTGALYTRYKNKDELFEYLVSEVLIVMGTYGKEAMEHYYKAQETKNISDFLEAVSFESEMYLNILFDYYEQSVLLFCRSDGSLVGKKLNQMIEAKVENTVIYVTDYLTNAVDQNAVRLLMNAGFSTYRSLLETVKEKNEAGVRFSNNLWLDKTNRIFHNAQISEIRGDENWIFNLIYLIPQFFEGRLTRFCCINGKDIGEMSIGETGEMVSSVFQDPRSQFFTINSSTEVAFGLENHGMSESEIRKWKKHF